MILWIHVVRGQNIWGVQAGHVLISLMYLTTRWPQVTDEEDAIMRPWASTMHSREQSESRSR